MLGFGGFRVSGLESLGFRVWGLEQGPKSLPFRILWGATVPTSSLICGP